MQHALQKRLSNKTKFRSFYVCVHDKTFCLVLTDIIIICCSCYIFVEYSKIHEGLDIQTLPRCAKTPSKEVLHVNAKDLKCDVCHRSNQDSASISIPDAEGYCCTCDEKFCPEHLEVCPGVYLLIDPVLETKYGTAIKCSHLKLNTWEFVRLLTVVG